MFLKLRKSIGQSVTEYAIACAAIISGVMAMQAFVKRGVEGRIQGEMEEFAGIGSLTAQHEQMTATYNGNQSSGKTVNADVGGGNFNTSDTATRTLTENY